MKRFLMTAIGVLLLTMTFVLNSTASMAQANNLQTPIPRLTIIGTGEAHATPDLAVISIGVVTQANSAREASQANSRAMNEAVNSLRAQGIAPRDLQTSGFSIQPLYVADPNRAAVQRIASFRAQNTLTVRIRDLNKVGDILERAVELGANRVSGPDFLLSEPEGKRDEARKAAMADALARAKLYADGLGFRLGRILNVSEASQPYRSRNVYPAQARAEISPSPPPIEAGESDISVSVMVEWEIVPNQ